MICVPDAEAGAAAEAAETVMVTNTDLSVVEHKVDKKINRLELL